MRRRAIILLGLLLAGAGLGLFLAHLVPAPAETATSTAALGLVLLDSDEGVFVLAVKDKSTADQAGIHPGDLLLQADGQPFATILQLEALLPASKQFDLQLMRRPQEVLTVRLRLQ